MGLHKTIIIGAPCAKTLITVSLVLNNLNFAFNTIANKLNDL